MNAMSIDFDPQRLWQARANTQPPVTLDDVRRRARRFQRQARRRQIEGWGGIIFCALLAPPALLYAWSIGRTWLTLIGCALIFAGAIVGCWRWRVMNSAEPIPDEDKSLVEAYRRNLIRLRDVRSNLFVQVFVPTLPGLVLGFTGAFLEHPGPTPSDAAVRLFLIQALVVLGLAVTITCLVNGRIAHKVQRTIDEL